MTTSSSWSADSDFHYVRCRLGCILVWNQEFSLAIAVCVKLENCFLEKIVCFVFWKLISVNYGQKCFSYQINYKQVNPYTNTPTKTKVKITYVLFWQWNLRWKKFRIIHLSSFHNRMNTLHKLLTFELLFLKNFISYSFHCATIQLD